MSFKDSPVRGKIGTVQLYNNSKLVSLGLHRFVRLEPDAGTPGKCYCDA